MVAEVTKYIEISNNIDSIIKKSPYKTSYIINNLGMKEVTFFKKMREKKFTPIEIFNISKILYPEEYKKQQDLMEIQAGWEDIKAGRVENLDDVVTELLQDID